MPPPLIAGETADQASTRVFLWLAGAVVASSAAKAGPGVLAPLGLPHIAVAAPLATEMGFLPGRTNGDDATRYSP